MIRLSDYWMGTEASLWQVLHAISLYEQNPALYPPLGYRTKTKLLEEDDGIVREEDEGENTRLLKVEDDIGYLYVDGPLTAQESWLDQYFGMVSYPELARNVSALAQMYQDGDIKQIVHVWNSPGGDASGINGVTEVLRGALEIAPDTVSYTNGIALSAGYWLASVNPKIYTDKMAELGSIGVISTIKSYARMLEADGIDVKVVRSGKFKALLHPYEPISDAGLREVERKGAEMHEFFLEHVETSRPRLKGGRGAWGEGQTFFGAKAIEIGLADGPVMTLNTLVNTLKSRHNVGNNSPYSFSNSNSNDRGNSMPHPTQVIFQSEADQAAVASGAKLDAVAHTEVETPEPPVVAAQETPVEPTGEASSNDMVRFLKDELKEARKEVDELKVKLALAEKESAKLAATEELLAPIVREATNKLQIALRQTPTNLAGLPAAVLATQYAEIKAQFEHTMPVGAHARSETDTSREPQDAGEQRLFLVK